jgi:hypothetical protein
MKKCGKCGIYKAFSDFNKRSGTSRLASYCRICHAAYIKRHYTQNKSYYRAKAKTSRATFRKWYDELKSHLQCERCGENHPATLDFHHKDGREKEESVAVIVVRCESRRLVLKEIEKCVVLCSNCHRILHHEERRSRGVVDALQIPSLTVAGSIPAGTSR